VAELGVGAAAFCAGAAELCAGAVGGFALCAALTEDAQIAETKIARKGRRNFDDFTGTLVRADDWVDLGEIITLLYRMHDNLREPKCNRRSFDSSAFGGLRSG
jgi:hypothetical protein